MGEVYRAIDTNLKREVAIKVLPQTLGADPERLARFQCEAEVLAADTGRGLSLARQRQPARLPRAPTLLGDVAGPPLPLR